MNIKTQTADLCEGPFLKKIILYTIPIILTGTLQMLFNAADLVIVGRFCGSDSVGAVGATTSLINLLVNLFMGLSVGAGVCVAQGLGAKDDDAVHKTIHTAIPTAFVSGVFLTVFGICFSRQFLEWMGTPEDVIELSALYLKIYFAGIIPILLYNFGASMLRAAGDTNGPLIFLSSAGMLNVVMNVVFVTVFDLNVAGVALATTLSQVVSSVLVMIRLARRKDACHFSPKAMRFHPMALKKIVRIGLPAGLQGSLFSISNVIIQSSVNSLAIQYGTALLDGNTAASNLESFVYVTMASFQQAAINFIGQNVGARKFENVGKILRICLGCVTVVGLVIGWTAIFGRESLLSIYIEGNEEAISYGATRLWISCSLYFLCGVMDVLSGSLRGMGASTYPMFICIIGVCGLRLVWIWTVFSMEAFHTLQWLVFSWPLSWAVTSLALFGAYILVKRRLIRKSAAV